MAGSDFILKNLSYHLDDMDVNIVDQVDALALPPPETAKALIDTFFETIHPTYPLLSETLFRTQYKNFNEGYTVPESNHRWLAILNLVFATSAVYAHLVDAEWEGDDRDHLHYFARARQLALDQSHITEIPDLQQLQAYSVAAIYLVSSNQMNRFVPIM